MGRRHRWSKRPKPVDEDIIVTEKDVRGKEDDPIDIAVDEKLNFVSKLPSETLDEILSYLILDHDPERGVKIHKNEGHSWTYKDPPHILLSLARLFNLLHTHVESFCRRHLAQHKDVYNHVPKADKDATCRRSVRLQATPREDTRCYRVELVRHLQSHCIPCGGYVKRRPTMATGVACHASYEDQAFWETIVWQNYRSIPNAH